MSVTVTTRASFSEKTPPARVYTRGRATFVDGRGNLLILDTPDVDLAAGRDSDGRIMFGKPEMETIKHTIATYAEGAWASVEVDS